MPKLPTPDPWFEHATEQITRLAPEFIHTELWEELDHEGGSFPPNFGVLRYDEGEEWPRLIGFLYGIAEIQEMVYGYFVEIDDQLSSEPKASRYRKERLFRIPGTDPVRVIDPLQEAANEWHTFVPSDPPRPGFKINLDI